MGLNYSAAKCKAMLVTAKQNVEAIPIKIDDNPLEYIKEFKYLGVTITNKLKWDKHLEKTRSAIIKKIHHARAAFEDKG